jgi:3-hydroxyacyl-[acyl-carrier-protein] dehydratase
MRWNWIDKFIDMVDGESAVAIKTWTMAEDHLHDLQPDFPIVPHALIVEGMAQTAGLLIGAARDYKEKVVLAKVGKAVFHRLVRPGDTILFYAKVDQFNDAGASITGHVTFGNAASAKVRQTVSDPGPGDDLVAEIELMFSHVDQNMGGIKFPEHNFVFENTFKRLVDDFRVGNALKI